MLPVVQNLVNPQGQINRAALPEVKRTVDRNIKQWFAQAQREKKSLFVQQDGQTYLITPNKKVYVSLKNLGGGAYKESHQMVKVAEKTSYAVDNMNKLKVISLARPQTLSNPGAKAELEQEMEIHRRFKQIKKDKQKRKKQNPIGNVCIGTPIVTVDGKMGIKTKYMAGGTLDNYIKNTGYFVNDTLNQVTLGQHALSFAKGLQQLHKQKIVHRDIKPDNLVLDDKIGRIIDFGKAFRKDASFERTPLPYMFLSPEAIDALWNGKTDGVNTAENDIFMLGITFYLMAVGRDQSHFAGSYNLGKLNLQAVQNDEKAKAFLELRQNSKQWMDYKNIPHTFRSIIKEMTKENPAERPKIKAVVKKLKALIAEKEEKALRT